MKIHEIFVLFYLSNIIFICPNLLKKYPEWQKINRIFNDERGGNILLNIEKYKYPKANETLRQIYKQIWLDYYKCLREKHVDTGHEKITYPNALIALEDTSVILKCQICISPSEISTVNLVKWYFNSSSDMRITKNLVEKIDHIIISPDNRYISMYKLKLEQAGQYWCEMGDTVGPPYYLYIESDFETINVYSDTVPYAPQAIASAIVPEYALKVYTSWTTWSSCSTCDIVGIKLRYGYCIISPLKTSTQIDENVTLTAGLRYQKAQGKNINHKTVTNENLKIQIRTALTLFKNRLPCKSRLVPKQIQITSAIKTRKIEIMKRYCKKKCLKNLIFEVRDEKGNILESANNSAGIYSMIQGMPVLLPSVTRIVVYKKYDKKIKLICPGNLNTNTPIVWQIGDKMMIPSHIQNQTNGRIYINPQMHILFQSLKFEDTNTYSCWQNNELIGIIKLNVTGETELEINHHVFLIGAITIICVFLLMFWKAFKGRTRYTMH